MKRARDLTPEEFEKLLAWLDSDRDKAGSEYTAIQCRLTKVFAARGCVDPETLGQEVLNRVGVRIDTVVQNYPDPLRCCLGFIDNVHREYLREEKKKANVKEPPDRRPTDELENEDYCLEQCLNTLGAEERGIFERYFQGEKRVRIDSRKKLALELGITANALRIRAHHLRKEMHECIVTCIGQT
jgi:hypothetical protein